MKKIMFRKKRSTAKKTQTKKESKTILLTLGETEAQKATCPGQLWCPNKNLGLQHLTRAFSSSSIINTMGERKR